MNAEQPLWKPSQQGIEQSAMFSFISFVNHKYQLSISNYAELHQWSIDQPGSFWQAIAVFCDLKMSIAEDTVYCAADHLLNTKWFSGSRLNFAENLLKPASTAQADNLALIFHGENGSCIRLSYRQLYQEVLQLATALQGFGVQPGDRVVGLVANRPEAIVAMLATVSIGGVWSACSPDFGFNGIMDRFGQISPKVLFAVDGYFFKGKALNCMDIVEQLEATMDSLSAVIVIPYIGVTKQSYTGLHKMHCYADLLKSPIVQKLEFTQLPFDHPLYIMYSSGTTGKPKCIVHGSGGTLIQHVKELLLHTDLKSTERLFYYTTCGWMMWNWMVSGLALGATLVLYDGSPFYPNETALLDIIEQDKINVFGTSAKYIAALEKAGVKPRQTHDLSALRCILSTGSPLVAESFDYVYNDIKSDVQLASISGGTDIISCFALGNPMLPVYRGELQCKGLGMDVAIYDDNAHPVVKQKGELVCRSAFPSMPIYFWNDNNKQRYKEAYFSRFNNVWAQADYAELSAHDGLIIYGRSDAVLNPGGIRIGTAEIYRQVAKLPEVLESIAVGQHWKDDVRVILFVQLRASLKLNGDLQDSIRQVIRSNTTVRHVPAKILQVADIPRTMSGKIVELAVRDIIHHKTVNNQDALANPEALEYFKQFSILESDG